MDIGMYLSVYDHVDTVNFSVASKQVTNSIFFCIHAQSKDAYNMVSGAVVSWHLKHGAKCKSTD